MKSEKWALVTGASSGVGLAYSRVLARDYHYNILLVSNQKEELEACAADIEKQYSVRAIPRYQDLSALNAADGLYEFAQAQGLEIELLINNAGIFYMRYLNSVPVKKIEAMQMIHTVTLTKLCRLFGAEMAARGKGYILNMSSMTAWMSMPGIQVYNATKAFVLNLSQSLWYELKPQGVNVTCLTPGCIDTPLYGLDDKTRKRLVWWGISLTPEELAKRALKALHKGKKQAMPGWCNHLFVPIINNLPDWAVFIAMKHLKCFQEN